MKILHYSLGLPPNRSGGLTKYATDLMVAQSTKEVIVTLLYPGDYTFWKKPKMRIVKDKTYKGITVYEIKNPSLVPLLHGVRKPEDVYASKHKLSGKSINSFYDEVQPEIMHIHTLMGLPLELIVFFKEKGVKIVFTTHDYYGLCPKVNFINQSGLLCNTPGGVKCSICNEDAPRSLFLYLRNSKYLLKQKERLSSFSNNQPVVEAKFSNLVSPSKEMSEEFDKLLDYYQKLFKLVDIFHFNSSVSKEVYENYLIPKQSIVIPISHLGIKDKRKLKTIDKNNISLAFIGSLSSFKGFPILKEVLCTLNNKVHNWSLDVWGGVLGVDVDCNKINYRGKYSQDMQNVVFDNIDLLIVPSIWKETFSLITLEALSYGVPVIVSSNVGAKDIIKNYDKEFIVEPTFDALYNRLEIVLNNPSLLENYNKKINSELFDFNFETHIQKIKQLYLSIL